jgi:hypothetical protein
MCHSTWTMTSRLEARTKLLSKWRRGNWRYGSTVYCPQHGGWHLGLGRTERP